MPQSPYADDKGMMMALSMAGIKQYSVWAEEYEYEVEEKVETVDEDYDMGPGLDLTKKRTEPRLMGVGPISKELRKKMDEVAERVGEPNPPPGGYLVNDPQEELKKAFAAHRQSQSIRQRTTANKPGAFVQQHGYTATTTHHLMPQVKGPSGPYYNHVGDIGGQGVPLNAVSNGAPSFQVWVQAQYESHTKTRVDIHDLVIKWDGQMDGYLVNYYNGQGMTVAIAGKEARDVQDRFIAEMALKQVKIDMEKAKEQAYRDRDKDVQSLKEQAKAVLEVEKKKSRFSLRDNPIAPW